MKQLLLIAALTVLLSACGQSGALYLPETAATNENVKKHD